MNQQELIKKLNELRSLRSENEIVEFKEASESFDFTKIGKYFSALSNEANLLHCSCAWLVFGIENSKHQIKGTKYRLNPIDLHKLKKEIADKTSHRITFIEIFEVLTSEGRVILFQIPTAPKGIPVNFEGHYYGRDNESLVPLNISELERIRNQQITEDWTAVIIDDATIEDLDEKAIKKAKIEFIKRNPKYTSELSNWNTEKFLAKAKLTIKGKITRTALILLGKEESEHFLGSTVKIRWNLKTIDNQDKDFDVFSIPFLLSVDDVYTKIRNLKYRYLREGTLFPDEVLRYDPFNIRESLNNAIAHQDYAKGARINVVEFEDDHLVFSNYGTFLPKSIEDVVLNDVPEEKYRNPFLVEAMKNLDMIETQGGGIRKIFNFQRNRFFPLPDFDLSDGKFKVTIIGKILNEEFARILIKNPQLSIEDIILLDKVQKHKTINQEEFNYLKKKQFIDGRKSNFYLSYKVIEHTHDENLKAEYIANKSFDDAHFKEMIIKYLELNKSKRSAIDNLIIPKLSASLTEIQKKSKVTNYLSSLRMEGKIRSLPGYFWEII
jgi:ATP-dependent DNA helicase RecG